MCVKGFITNQLKIEPQLRSSTKDASHHTTMDPEMAQMMLQQAGGGIPRDLSTPDK